MPTRYHLGTAVTAASNADGVMDALTTLFAVAADVDTAAAVSGVLTWTRDSTAGSEAIYSNAFGPRNCRIIIAVHDSGTPSPSPTMVASADTYTAANVLIGLCLNASGAYAGWNQSAPFSGCAFAGYYRFVAVASTTFRAMLSSQDLFIQATTSAGVHTAHFGSVVRATGSYAESDGFRYGGAVSGVGDMNTAWRSSTNVTAGYFLKNGATNGQPHTGCYAVGGTSWQTMTTGALVAGGGTTDSGKWDSTTVAKTGILVRRNSAPEYTTGSWAGVGDSPNGLSGQNVTGTSGSGVRFGSSVVTTDEESVIVWRSFS